jgi:hypothetical protein
VWGPSLLAVFIFGAYNIPFLEKAY